MLTEYLLSKVVIYDDNGQIIAIRPIATLTETLAYLENERKVA